MSDFEIQTLHGELCYAKRDSMGDLRIELGSVYNDNNGDLEVFYFDRESALELRDFISEAFDDE